MGSEPPVTHGIRPKRTGPPSIDLYIPEKDREWVKEMQAALKRDGSSISAWTLQEMKKWWEEHRPGNPQTGLERYADDAPVLPGPDVPGSVHFTDRDGKDKWGWWKDLPQDYVILVQRDFKRVALQVKLTDPGALFTVKKPFPVMERI